MNEEKHIEIFKEENPTLESYWRAIILFGKNVASYKFALAQSLLELSDSKKSDFTLEELAAPFAAHICEHLKKSPKQGTSSSSVFLSACRDFNNQQISYDELINATVKNGFTYVLDAFHVVNNNSTPIHFYEKKFTSKNKGIILSDNLYKLRETPFFHNFFNETESRWNLVETAWSLNISRNLLNVKFDDRREILFVDDKLRRKDVTSARDAINGYQKGKCFYCYDNIDLNSTVQQCDVDHFFPYILQSKLPGLNLNGVWNLVLACPACNREENGKFAKVPAIKYLERLYMRNEYLISSHHPLRETLIMQTGKTSEERAAFLKVVDKEAVNMLIRRWDTQPKGDETF